MTDERTGEAFSPVGLLYPEVRPDPGLSDFQRLLDANSPQGWARDLQVQRNHPEPCQVVPAVRLSTSEKLRSGLASRLRRVAVRLADTARPVVSPIAWRARTFLSQPNYDVELRLGRKIDERDLQTSSQLADLMELVRTVERATTSAATEQRGFFVSILNAIEEQATELGRLEGQLANLRVILDSRPAAAPHTTK